MDKTWLVPRVHEQRPKHPVQAGADQSPDRNRNRIAIVGSSQSPASRNRNRNTHDPIAATRNRETEAVAEFGRGTVPIMRLVYVRPNRPISMGIETPRGIRPSKPITIDGHWQDDTAVRTRTVGRQDGLHHRRLSAASRSGRRQPTSNPQPSRSHCPGRDAVRLAPIGAGSTRHHRPRKEGLLP